MGSPVIAVQWLNSDIESFDHSFDVQIREGFSSESFDSLNGIKFSVIYNHNIPEPPPIPKKHSPTRRRSLADSAFILNETKQKWDKIFKDGYGADVHIVSQDGSIIVAHSFVLMAASPVLRNLLQHSNVQNGMRSLKINGIPYSAVYAFIRFLYSSCYEEEDMKKFVLHLLVLSHSYTIPSLKRECEHFVEHCWLTKDNAIDVLQLARSCDAPRLAVICQAMVVRDFKCISSTEGWKAMKRADPLLEQELVASVVEADSRKRERSKKIEDKKVYMLLYEAMEALLHICKDGCKTIGPYDKALKGNLVCCSFKACKGLETLIRHFYGCKTRVPGGCSHCKRMWQLLELHSRMCNEPDLCKVPLCRHFKLKTQGQSKKDKAMWRLLVSKVIASKIESRGPFSSRIS